MAQLSVTPRTAGDVTRLGLAGRITISVSHLHSLFAGRDTTVAARVRRRRLQRARRDLGDPALGGPRSTTPPSPAPSVAPTG
ncbi:hypothetical protein ABZ697_14615 [Streptomyces albidoflavus]|uniref:hypothetical protein n=1 Tax=Streptomyces albidoflavus TaxID=1886 RepID=UPI0033E2F1EE